ncbi:DUF3487 family protein [Vibrio parahaemolyticus]|uniref:Uncharacterized protein n=1 Tax=Vibrio parahaemolyticus TaxID=670 RepID=A0AAW3IQ63_VIBPH|nr:hypothetical protein ACX05_21615 [Vibrio parahaemolyticus]
MSDIHKPNFVPDRINAEPPIFMGLTMGELRTVAVTRFILSLVVVEMAVTAIYPHVFSYTGGVLGALFIASTLIIMKAMSIVETQRGKDPFYCQHQADISIEIWRSRLFPSTKDKSKSKHSFLVEDRFWSPR